MKTKTIILFASIILLITAAYFAYSALSRNYSTESKNGSSSSVSLASGSSDVSSSAPQSSKAASNPASDFTVKDSQGNNVNLSDFKGKPVVLNFWASWCSPCKNEMPHFNDVYNKYKDDVVFMMVNLTDGQRETQAKAESLVSSKGYDFPVYFDTDLSASDTYNIMYIPTTVLIDSDGNIIKKYDGGIDEETLTQGVQSLIK